MIPNILSFFLGVLFLQTLPKLPNFHELGWFIFIILFIYIIIYFIKKYFKYNLKYIIYIIPFSLGFLWVALYAIHILSWNLPKTWEGKPLVAIGHIASIPEKNEWQTSFLFSVHTLINNNNNNNNNNIYHKKSIIKLIINNKNLINLIIKPGEEWALPVKLKRIHSTQNLAAFDFEKWALQHGIRASGVVIYNKNLNYQPQLLSYHWYRYPIEQFRYFIKHKILTYLPHTERSAWLMTLIIGEHEGVPKADWEILRQTGTNHLMAIAGLHIGLLAEFTYLLINLLVRRVPILLLYLPANFISLIISLIFSLIYSVLAGFSIPTERALIMLFLLILVILYRNKINAWCIWSMALFFVLILNPLSVLSDSFYLSFGTIALIIYGMTGRVSPSGIWWKWFRVQWVIGLGLIPVSLFLFQEFSLISFLANSIAIPWLGFLVLPLCFLSVIFLFISSILTKFFLYLANLSLEYLWVILSWFSHLSIASWHVGSPNYLILLLSVLGILILLMPKGMPGKFFGMIWLLPLFFSSTSIPKIGEYWVTLLDVGQGLSVVVQTQSHLLLYDTGPKFRDFDLGKNVVLPYFYNKNIKKIDMLVISHGDNDHIGGADSIQLALPVYTIKTSVPEKFKTQASYCLTGEKWEWDGVNFSFLYPSKEDIDLNFNNDNSCVLMIDNGAKRTLLTGDIEKYAEEKLLINQSNLSSQLSAFLLIAPHHGSKTSGLKKFIKSISPNYVLYATGYRNRYHFPHASVIDTYNELGIKQFNTADTGMLQFKFSKIKEERGEISLFRMDYPHYWFDK
jgi:competence protein ComEC